MRVEAEPFVPAGRDADEMIAAKKAYDERMRRLEEAARIGNGIRHTGDFYRCQWPVPGTRRGLYDSAPTPKQSRTSHPQTIKITPSHFISHYPIPLQNNQDLDQSRDNPGKCTSLARSSSVEQQQCSSSSHSTHQQQQQRAAAAAVVVAAGSSRAIATIHQPAAAGAMTTT